jgi:hypothetical protein
MICALSRREQEAVLDAMNAMQVRRWDAAAPTFLAPEGRPVRNWEPGEALSAARRENRSPHDRGEA